MAPNQEKPHTTPLHSLIYSIYISVVRPHLESSWFQRDKGTLERVLGKVVKMVAGLKGDDYLEK